MDFLFDVADLPVALTRWNSHKLSENDLLCLPSYDDLCEWDRPTAAKFLEDEDEQASDLLSLGSCPSDVSTRIHAFELDMDMDCESVPSSLQSSPVVPPPLLPPVRLPTASLNLKLDAAKVAIDWAQLTGNARPVFSMPRTQLAAVAPAIPSAASLAASVSPTALPGLGLEAVPDAKPAAVVVKPTSTLPSAPPTAKPSITKSKKASSSKRPRSGKSNDKRPRFKGRFVKQEELERLQMEEEQSLSETSETAVVPDSMLLW